MEADTRSARRSWRVFAAFSQLALALAGAMLNLVPVVDRVQMVEPTRMSAALAIAGDACIATVFLLAVILHGNLRGAVLDGDRPETGWFSRAARWNRLMALGCLAGGLVGMAITRWCRDATGVEISAVVAGGGFALFGGLSLLWRAVAIRRGEDSGRSAGVL
jgi:hypothetical protein